MIDQRTNLSLSLSNPFFLFPPSARFPQNAPTQCYIRANRQLATKKRQFVAKPTWLHPGMGGMEGGQSSYFWSTWSGDWYGSKYERGALMEWVGYICTVGLWANSGPIIEPVFWNFCGPIVHIMQFLSRPPSSLPYWHLHHLHHRYNQSLYLRSLIDYTK